MKKQSTTLIPIDLEFHYQGGNLTAKITIKFSVPNIPPAPPIPINLDAHECYSDADSLIRWQADEPFFLIPKNSGDWQKKKWETIPNTKPWLLVLSKPGPQGKQYLELWTRTSRSSETRADYWVFPLPQGAAARRGIRAFKNLKGSSMVNGLRALLEGILSSDAVKATIIISE